MDEISKLEDVMWKLPGKAAQRLRQMAVQVSKFIAEVRAQYSNFMSQERKDWILMLRPSSGSSM